MDNQTYIVAGCKPWNRLVFDEVISKFPGRWFYIGDQRELSLGAVQNLNPRYLFFLNWSWRVSDELVNNYECVCFHPTDLPYGQGGSPIQNLISRGHSQTKLTAFQMTPQLDQGPIYFKEDLSLEGTAQDIFLRFMGVASLMIQKMIQEEPKPQLQTGRVTVFKRRRPEESEIPPGLNAKALYDFIRMLDAPGYPKAFVQHKGLCFEFSNASLSEDKILARVSITPLKKS